MKILKKTQVFLVIIIANFFILQNVLAVDETTVEKLVTNEFQGGGIAQGWHGDDTAWDYTLPFPFNFYGTDYTNIRIGSNGNICFDDSYYCGNWRINFNDHGGVPGIYALLADLRTDLGSSNIFVTENPDNVVIRWKATEWSHNTVEVNFEVVLYDNGNIKINYGDQSEDLIDRPAIVGIVKGDYMTYTESMLTGQYNLHQKQTSTWGFVSLVNSKNPSDNSNGVSLDTNLRITFDRDMYVGSGNIIIRKMENDSMVESIDVSSEKITGWGTNTLTIDPEGTFNNLTDYYVNIDNSAIKDASDNYFDGISDNSSWNFKTEGINYIIKSIPDGECYEIGTLEDNSSDNTIIKYSNDNQLTWDYVPTKDKNGFDCKITDVKLIYADFLNTISEDLENEFSGELIDTEIISDGNGKIKPIYYPSGAYTWKDYNLSNIYEVETDELGNIFVLGIFDGDDVNLDPTSGTDLYSNADGLYASIFFTKFNASGVYEYTLVMPVSSTDFELDSYGNIFIAGSFSGTDIDLNPTSGVDLHSSNGSSDIFITKINADGSYGYTYTMGGVSADSTYKIGIDSLDNIFINGSFQGSDADLDPTAGTALYSSNGGTDIFITKINSDGSFGYTYTMGGSGWDGIGFSDGLAIDSSNNVFIFGYYSGANVDLDPTPDVELHSSIGSNDVLLTKINADESFGYTLTGFGTGSDVANSIVIDQGDNIFITGNFYGSGIDFDLTAGIDNTQPYTGSADLFLSKYNSDGSYGWTRTFGTASTYESPSELDVDDSGNVFISQQFNGQNFDFDPTPGTDLRSSNGETDANITKINADGSYGWTRTFGETKYDTVGALSLNSTSIFIGGYFNEPDVDLDPTDGEDIHSSRGQSDAYLIKLNTDGSYEGFRSFYEKTSYYEVEIAPENTPTSWDSLRVEQSIPTGTSMKFEILDADCENSLISPTSGSEIDLSNIDASSNDKICLRAIFLTNDDQTVASLDSWEISYYSKTKNSNTTFSFDALDKETDDYAHYKEYRKKYTSDSYKQDYKKVKELKKKEYQIYLKMKEIYLRYKLVGDGMRDELKQTNPETYKMYKEYRRYRKYKQYKAYKEDVFGN